MGNSMSTPTPSIKAVLAAQMPRNVMTKPSRYNLMPVDVVFGVVRDRPGQQVVMTGDQVRTNKGEIFYFVGLDHQNFPYLAKDERELAKGAEAIERMRLRFQSHYETDPKQASVSSEEPIKTASVDTFLTTEGKLKFKIDTKEFAQFLSTQGIRGGEAGKYLRGEEMISEALLRALVGAYKPGYGSSEKYKVQVMGGPRVVVPGQTRKSPLPDIQWVWDKLVEGIWKDTKSGGLDAGDMFVNMGPEYEDGDFDQYLQQASGDVGQSYEHALSGPTGDLFEKFKMMLRTGEYTGGGYDNWNWRHRNQLLQEIYADAWYEGIITGWKKIQANPRELARLKALRVR